jgi:hypothetical protein
MVALIAGLILLSLAALCPSELWLQGLRGPEAEFSVKLLNGARLFRVSLGALGVFLLLARRFSFWSSETRKTRQVAPARRAELFGVAMLVLAGAILRLYRLDEGLWIDEVSTLVDYVRLPMGEIVTTYGSQNQHFLFSILARASVVSFGESAWSLRLPAALFGIATLWACWQLGREITTSREALLGTFVLAFSYQHIWFSQNARGYSALLFFTVLSTSFLVQGVCGTTRRAWLGYALTAALGMYTHMTMIFVVAGQFAAFAWVTAFGPDGWRSSRSLPLFSGFGAAGLLTLVCYALVLPQIPDAAAADLSNVATWRSVGWMLEEIGRGFSVGPLLAVAGSVGLAVLAVGLTSYWRQSPVVPLVFMLSTIAGAATMIALGHHLWPRFFFFAAVFAILVAVRGVHVITAGAGRMLRWSDRRTAALASWAIIVATVFLARSIPYVYRPKQDYAGARDFIQAARQPGDAVVAVGIAALPFRVYYAPDWVTASTAGELDAIRTASGRTWVVYTLPIELENTYPDIHSTVVTHFPLIRTFDGSLGGGALYVHRVDAVPPREGF